MEDHQEEIRRLELKLDRLVHQQNGFAREVEYLRWEINQLKSTEGTAPRQAEEKALRTPSVRPEEAVVEQKGPAPLPPRPLRTKEVRDRAPRAPRKFPKPSLDLEKFIGENLISKIGIAITVIGVAIGAKYSIEHNLINPLNRVILGYLAGLALLGTGIRLKAKYPSYSAVLVSGAMTILYFITYSAYAMYGLLPQTIAFGLMVLFTIFTVLAALNYDREIIALIGLVGAYAVPFLLSEDTGNVAILFTYTAIINVGILVIAFRKYWKVLYYAAFGLTWLIYLTWMATGFRTSEHFGLALGFLLLFFLLFYLTFLAYKLVRKEQFGLGDIALLLVNSFLFYGLGYLLLSDHPTGSQLLGVFTLGNAILHFGVATAINRQQLTDKKLLYLVAGLVLVFITIAIPVQLDGNWVTLLWAGEAVLMFWVGRTKQIAIYEGLAYGMMFLAFSSIAQDWDVVYGNQYFTGTEVSFTPFLNIHFLSSLLFVAAFGFITFLSRDEKYAFSGSKLKEVAGIMAVVIPIIFVFSLYNAFRVEIVHYWDALYRASVVSASSGVDDYSVEYRNYDLNNFKMVWVVNYTLLFVSLLSLVNMQKLKSRTLGWVNLGLNVLVILAFLVAGLYALSELRESYLSQDLVEYYQRGSINLWIRYVSYLFVGLTLGVTYRYLRQDFMAVKLNVGFDLLLHLSILWMASSELLHWMDIGESAQSYKLGLSILWGTYALFLIALGIWKKKQHLRIGAILLFGVTLVKLFFYDISHLDTIAKTIVFVSLGVLLLIISFLYNKYKHIIADETNQ